MTNQNMFEMASRKKLRFVTTKGSLTVEELWDLPLITKKGNGPCLDDIAKAIHKRLRDNDERISFVREVREDDTDSLSMDIVLHIINTKMAEESDAHRAAIKRDKKNQILAIIAEKENETLKGASIEELRKMLADL